MSTLSGSNHCVRGRIYLLKRATAWKMVERPGYIVGFAQSMSVPKSHGRRTQLARELCGTHIILWFVVEASKSVPGSKWTVSVPCARHEGANRLRSPAPPPPPTLHKSFFIYIQQFSCHHLPAPNTSVNKRVGLAIWEKGSLGMLFT